MDKRGGITFGGTVKGMPDCGRQGVPTKAERPLTIRDAQKDEHAHMGRDVLRLRPR